MNIYAHAIYIERYVRQWPYFWKKRLKIELMAVRIDTGERAFEAYDADYRSTSDERKRYKHLFDRLPALDTYEWMTHSEIKDGVRNTVFGGLSPVPIEVNVITNGDPFVASLVASLLHESNALPGRDYRYISTQQMGIDASEFLVDENFDITSSFTEIIQKPTLSEYTPDQRMEMIRSHDLLAFALNSNPYDLQAVVARVKQDYAVMIAIMRESQYHLLHTEVPADETEED